MNLKGHPILQMVARCMYDPLKAAEERRREERIHGLAVVLNTSPRVAEEVAPRLCDDFGLSLEGLYRKLAAGDDEVWAKARVYCRLSEAG